ncbi:unnamed protein product [Ectocarpus fasciculatus]
MPVDELRPFSFLQAKWDDSERGVTKFNQEVLPLVRPLAPSQNNGSDCGMYALRYAKARPRLAW